MSKPTAKLITDVNRSLCMMYGHVAAEQIALCVRCGAYIGIEPDEGEEATDVL